MKKDRIDNITKSLWESLESLEFIEVKRNEVKR